MIYFEKLPTNTNYQVYQKCFIGYQQSLKIVFSLNLQYIYIHSN